MLACVSVLYLFMQYLSDVGLQLKTINVLWGIPYPGAKIQEKTKTVSIMHQVVASACGEPASSTMKGPWAGFGVFGGLMPY